MNWDQKIMIVYWVALCKPSMIQWANVAGISYELYTNNCIKGAIDLIKKYNV